MAEEVKLKSILIFDDDADQRRLVSIYINKLFKDIEVGEYDPLESGEPDDNFDWSKYDVLILDYYLCIHGVTGLDILQRNRKNLNFPATIMLTGAGNEEVAVRALKAGVYDYLRKQSLDKQELYQAINKAFNSHHETQKRKHDATLSGQAFDKSLFYRQLEINKDLPEFRDRVLIQMELDNDRDIAEREGIILRDNIVKHIAKQSYEIFSLIEYMPSVTRLSDAGIALLIDMPASMKTLEYNMEVLLSHLSEHPYIFNDKKIEFSVSVGLVTLTGDGESKDSLLRKAKSACTTAAMIKGNSFHISGLASESAPAPISPDEITESDTEPDQDMASIDTATPEPTVESEPEPDLAPVDIDIPETTVESEPDLAPVDIDIPETTVESEPEPDLAPVDTDIPETTAESKPEPDLAPVDTDIPETTAESKPEPDLTPVETDAPEPIPKSEPELGLAPLDTDTPEPTPETDPDLALAPVDAEPAQTEGGPDLAIESVDAEPQQTEGGSDLALAPVDAEPAQTEGEPDLAIESVDAEPPKTESGSDLALEPVDAEPPKTESGSDLALETVDAEPQKPVELEPSKPAPETELDLELQNDHVDAPKPIPGKVPELDMAAVDEQVPKSAGAEIPESAPESGSDLALTPAETDTPEPAKVKASEDNAKEESQLTESIETSDSDQKSGEEVELDEATMDEATKRLKKAFDEQRVVQTYQPVISFIDEETDNVDSKGEIHSISLQQVDEDGTIKLEDEIRGLLTTTELKKFVDHWSLRQVIGTLTNRQKTKDIFILKISDASLADAGFFNWLRKLLTGLGEFNPGQFIALQIDANDLATVEKQAIALMSYLRKSHDFKFVLGDIKNIEDIIKFTGNQEFDMVRCNHKIISELRSIAIDKQEKTEDDESIPQTQFDLIKSKGTRFIADNIENATVLTEVISNGAEYAMGDFIGEPVTQLEEFTNVESFEIV